MDSSRLVQFRVPPRTLYTHLSIGGFLLQAFSNTLTQGFYRHVTGFPPVSAFLNWVGSPNTQEEVWLRDRRGRVVAGMGPSPMPGV